MKNRLISLLILLLASTSVLAAGQLDSRTRREIACMLSRVVEREVSGAPVRIQAVKVARNRVEIHASVGLSYYPFREENVAAMRDSVRALLPAGLRKATIAIYTDRHEISDLIPLAFRSSRPKKAKDRPVRFVNRSERPLVTRLSAPTTPTQGLGNRHIALWQSHGRYFDRKENRWRWQRVRLWETCEDLYTQSYVLPYLVPMLENAGAVVMLPRERDVQKLEVIADNDVATQYEEFTGAQPWRDGGVGFACRQYVYRMGENPFRHGTTRQTTTVVEPASVSRAVWSADIPERGDYAVYVSYSDAPDRADDAKYTVFHLGGESKFAVNQTMGGGTWIYLGTFPLDAGHRPVVALSNLSQREGRTVSADAVKIGGGYGNIARPVCDSMRTSDAEPLGETSGYPRFCEGARYWLQWAGFDEAVYSPKGGTDDYKDDYMSRAHWVNALMGGSERLPDSAGLHVPIDLALAFHSDAGVRDGDGIVGTLGIFCTRDNKGRFVGGASRYRSRDLTDLVMTQIVSDVRRTWDPGWSRRGLWNRSYYEARVPGAPTMLLELLSHQNFTDMRYGNDPRFKFLVSRAIYKGILRYISSQYELPYVVHPLPVTSFSAVFASDGTTELTWSPVVDSLETTAVPDGYVVYTRVDDGGFDNGRYVDRPGLLVEQEPGRIYSYRVTAVNAGGESFPSETLAVCRVSDEKGCVLVVNGFDRISAPFHSDRDSLAGFYHDIDGGVPDRRDISFVGAQRIFDREMARCEDDRCALGACDHGFETEVIGGNTFDYPYLHGRSIAAAGYSFCSASVRAVEQGRVALDDYRCVDLILGKQRVSAVGRGLQPAEFAAFSPALQRELRQYAARNGALFVSGSYVVTDLWTGEGASEEGQAFAREVLHCEYDDVNALDDDRIRVVAPLPEFSRGDYRYYDEPGEDHYRVEAPDALKPADDRAIPVMRYVGSGRTACVVSDDGGKVVVLGFPFESLTSGMQRDRLMRDVLRYLEPAK